MTKPTTRFLLAVSSFAALAVAGCGVTGYTEIEARDATDGTTGFVFVDDAQVRGVVTAKEYGSGPRYALDVTFTDKADDAPRVRDVRVGMSVVHGRDLVDVPVERFDVTARICGDLAVCDSVAARREARPSPASVKLPDALDDFDVVVTYTLARAQGAETVTRRVSAHPVREEKHHYVWIFRDC